MSVPFHQRASITANTGLAFIVEDARRRKEPGTPEPRYDIIGVRWSISEWIDRGRSLDTDAVRLNAMMQSSLPTTSPLRAAFYGWYRAWQPFYDKYIGPNASTLSQANVSLNYEDFDKDLLERKSQFDSLASDFNRQSQQAKKEPFRPVPDLPPTGKDGKGLPWWFWLGTGVAALGVGYIAYRSLFGEEHTSSGRDVDDSDSADDDSELEGYEVVG